MTENAAAMAEVVGHVVPEFRALGFRKRRHVFNRETQPGLVQVVDFQMGQYTGSHFGSFTVNLGVWIAEVHRAIGIGAEPRFVGEPQCELRERLGLLMPERADAWWSLDPLDGAGVDALLAYGIPWLEGLASREAILERWRADGLAGLTNRGGLTAAVLLHERGELEEATAVIRGYLGRPLHADHAAYVRDVAARLGIDPG